MSSPCSVPARTDSLCEAVWAYIKYLLYFCKMSLNGLFGGQGEKKVLQCGSDAATHITCLTRFLVIVFSRLISCFIADAVCRAWG